MSDSPLFKGRLGLARSRIPHVDRHGLLWLSRGKLYVEDGTLRFKAGRERGHRSGRLCHSLSDRSRWC